MDFLNAVVLVIGLALIGELAAQSAPASAPPSKTASAPVATSQATIEQPSGVAEVDVLALRAVRLSKPARCPRRSIGRC